MIELLKNEIVINWIAPIITGLIVVAIPTGIIKKFKYRRDERTIKQANQRYIDSIMPFIIQEIKVSNSFISDVRNVIIEESQLREKYLYSEIDLRNKLVLEISESQYINEERKSELIKFTYEIFGQFKNDIKTTEEIETKNNNSKLKPSLIMFLFSIMILSEVIIMLVSIFDVRNIKPEDNVLIFLPFIAGFVAILILFLLFFEYLSESKVLRRKNYENIYRNYLVHYINSNKSIKEKIEKEKIINKSNQNNK